MTTFVHPEQPPVHPGLQRAEVLFGRFGTARYTGVGARHLLTLLLLAVVAVAVVVADVLVSDWTESRLLAAWVVLCGSLFAAVALYADALGRGLRRIAAPLRAFAEHNAAARADAHFLATAQSDPRVMYELQAAMLRHNVAQSDPRVMRELQAALRHHNAVAEAATASAARPEALARMSGRSEQARMPTLYATLRRLNASRHL